jgi:hypothetical protein
MDVSAWLRGLGLERYTPLFRDGDIDAEICSSRHRRSYRPGRNIDFDTAAAAGGDRRIAQSCGRRSAGTRDGSYPD